MAIRRHLALLLIMATSWMIFRTSTTTGSRSALLLGAQAFSMLPTNVGLTARTRIPPGIGSFRNLAVTPKRYRRPRPLAGKSKGSGDMFRADRVLANRSGKSRSECFELLKQKRVWEVDGKQNVDGVESIRFKAVAGPSAKISMNSEIYIDRVEAVPLPPALLTAYHKPKWVLSVRQDPHDRPCIDSVLPDQHPVGRLDYDTSGLLLFSSSGPLTQTLLHPKHGIDKEYVALVTGRVDSDALRSQLAQGVKTGEGIHTADLLGCMHLEDEAVAPTLQHVRNGLPAEYNQTDLKLKGYLDVFDATELSEVRLLVTEGKYRMVRRILANCGHPVVSLRRERLGAVTLGDLPEGATRPLTEEELRWAERLVPTKAKKPQARAQQ